MKIDMWAVIVRSKRSEWIHWPTIARTRREAWEKYEAHCPPAYQAEQDLKKKKVRLARVTVTAANREAGR